MEKSVKAFHEITPINKNMNLFIHALLHNHASRGIDVTFDWIIQRTFGPMSHDLMAGASTTQLQSGKHSQYFKTGVVGST